MNLPLGWNMDAMLPSSSTFKSFFCQQPIQSSLFIFFSVSSEPHLKSQNIYKYNRKARIAEAYTHFPQLLFLCFILNSLEGRAPENNDNVDTTRVTVHL